MDKKYGGPSGPDWKTAFDNNIPIIVMDADSIYLAFPPDSMRGTPKPGNPSDSTWAPAGNWQNKMSKFPRNGGSCTRP